MPFGFGLIRIKSRMCCGTTGTESAGFDCIGVSMLNDSGDITYGCCAETEAFRDICEIGIT